MTTWASDSSHSGHCSGFRIDIVIPKRSFLSQFMFLWCSEDERQHINTHYISCLAWKFLQKDHISSILGGLNLFFPTFYNLHTVLFSYWAVPAFLVSSHKRCVPIPSSPWWLPVRLLRYVHISLVLGDQNCTQYSRYSLINAKQSRMITSLGLLTRSCLMQPRISSAFLAAKAHCWLIFTVRF